MVVNSMSYATYDSYKESGVDWLGAIPSDWQSKKLGILLTEFSKKNNPNLPLLSITRELGVITRDMDDQESNHNFIPDDLSGYKLLKEGQFGMNKMKAWQGSYGISKYTGIVSPAYYVFDVSNEIYPNFFNIAIRSKFYVDFFGSASDGVRIGQWDLNKTRMREIPFIFPSLEQQKKIYEFLSKKIKQIDQAISLKQQQIEKLNEYKQIVIQNAVTKGLNPNVPMKDSGVEWIGDIPEHWEVKKIKEIATLKGRIGFRGYNASDLVNEDEGAITISPSNILDDKTFFEKNSYLSWKKYYESPEIMIFNDDILLVKTGSTVGKVGIVKNLNQSATINPQLLVFKKVKVNKDYLFFYLYSDFFFDLIKSNSIGSTIPTISETKIKNLPVVLPPDEEQLNILQKLRIDVDRFDKISKAYQIQIDRLKEYKNILINQAVTGKIKIY